MTVSYQERGERSSSAVLRFWASHHSSWVISSKYDSLSVSASFISQLDY